MIEWMTPHFINRLPILAEAPFPVPLRIQILLHQGFVELFRRRRSINLQCLVGFLWHRGTVCLRRCGDQQAADRNTRARMRWRLIVNAPFAEALGQTRPREPPFVNSHLRRDPPSDSTGARFWPHHNIHVFSDSLCRR